MRRSGKSTRSSEPGGLNGRSVYRGTLPKKEDDEGAWQARHWSKITDPIAVFPTGFVDRGGSSPVLVMWVRTARGCKPVQVHRLAMRHRGTLWYDDMSVQRWCRTKVAPKDAKVGVLRHLRHMLRGGLEVQFMKRGKKTAWTNKVRLFTLHVGKDITYYYLVSR